jgi:hypothetical protein
LKFRLPDATWIKISEDHTNADPSISSVNAGIVIECSLQAT